MVVVGLAAFLCRPINTFAGDPIPSPHPPPARIPTYTITDLGVLPGYEQSLALGLNDSGEVVGECWRTVFRDVLILEIKAFLYSDGVMTDLGTSENYSSAAAINESHQIAGFNTFPNLTTRAFLFDDGNLFDLSTQGCDTCVEATDINDQGQIIGTFSQGVFLWNGEMITDLGSLDDDFTQAVSINNSGMIVGNSSVWVPFPPFTQPRAFLWVDGQMTELPPLIDGPSKAADINDLGQVIGFSDGRDVLWENGRVLDLTAPPYFLLGAPEAINNHGEVVGYAGPLGNTHGIVWCGDATYDLNHLIQPNSRWDLEVASDVNDYGQIIGYGRLQSSASWTAFLLHPIDCDANDDERVDESDFALFQGCLGGPNESPAKSCDDLDFNRDGYVDVMDYRSLELAFEIP